MLSSRNWSPGVSRRRSANETTPLVLAQGEGPRNTGASCAKLCTSATAPNSKRQNQRWNSPRPLGNFYALVVVGRVNKIAVPDGGIMLSPPTRRGRRVTAEHD